MATELSTPPVKTTAAVTSSVSTTTMAMLTWRSRPCRLRYRNGTLATTNTTTTTSSDRETKSWFKRRKMTPAMNRATPKMMRAVMISLSCLPDPV